MREITRRRQLPVFRAILADSWRSLLAWCVAMLAVILTYLPLYSSINRPAMMEMIENLPPEMVTALRYDQIASGAGYTQATVFSLVGFVCIVIAGTQWGAHAIAGAEEDGSMELYLARGVGRVQYCLEASAAVLLRLSVVALITYLTIRLINRPAELDLKVRFLGETTIVWLGLGVLSAAVAILVGAAFGRRVWAIGASAFVAIAAYVIDAISRLDADLHWIADLSPVDWAFGDDPLSHGLDGWGEISLWVLSLVLVILATLVFRRRDVCLS